MLGFARSALSTNLQIWPLDNPGFLWKCRRNLVIVAEGTLHRGVAAGMLKIGESSRLSPTVLWIFEGSHGL
jgi:hypothetical protein